MSGRINTGRKTSTKAGSAYVAAMMANRNSTEPSGETSEDTSHLPGDPSSKPLSSPRGKATMQSVINAVRFQTSLASGTAAPSSSSPAKPSPGANVGMPSTSELSAEERRFLEERAALTKQPARQPLPASPVKVLSPRSERLYGPDAAKARKPVVRAPSAGRAAATAEPAHDITPGARVRVQKFDLMKDLNGQTGVVRRYDDDKGGYVVQLDKDGGTLCFLTKYLVVVDPGLGSDPSSPSGSRPPAGPDLSSPEARQALPSKAARMLGIKQGFDEEAEKREEERIRQLILEEEAAARAGIVKLHEDAPEPPPSGALGSGDADDGGSDVSSSEVDEEEAAAVAAAEAQTKARMAGLGFKLNLGSVQPNEVDEKKPEAVPHTPKGEIVEKLQAEGRAAAEAAEEAGSKGAGDTGDGSDVSSSEVDEEEAAAVAAAEAQTKARMAGLGFKLNLGSVQPNEVDEKKPEAVPHTPKGEIVEKLQAERAEAAAAQAAGGDRASAAASEQASARLSVAEQLSAGKVPSKESVDRMGIAELRELVAAAGLSTADCVEKSDLRSRAREAIDCLVYTVQQRTSQQQQQRTSQPEPQKRRVQLQEPTPAAAPAAQQQRGGGCDGGNGDQQEEILKEGWMLKEAGNSGKRGGLGVVGGAFKSALPQRRYFVLFAQRLDYFVHVNVVLKSGTGPGSARLGVTLNDWNMVTEVDVGGAADGLLHEGDVLVSVDEMSVAGLFVAEVMDSKKPKHLVGCIRRKGSVPLSAGAKVAPCKAALSKITSLASAFEIDLRGSAVKGDKDRYVLICASPDEADQWRDAISQQCKGDGTKSVSGDETPRLPAHVLKSASVGSMEQAGAGFGEDSSGSMTSINGR